MLRRTAIAATLAVIAATGCGCGTVGNICGDFKKPHPWDAGRKPTVYGGVEMLALHTKDMAESLVYNPPNWRDLCGGVYVPLALFNTICIAIDFPLTVVGDTVTLPITIPIALQGSAVKEKPGDYPSSGSGHPEAAKPMPN